MFVNIELVLPLPLMSPLHHMFSQYLGYALRVFQCCCAGYGAAFGGGVSLEFGAGVLPGGVEGWCVVCEE